MKIFIIIAAVCLMSFACGGGGGGGDSTAPVITFLGDNSVVVFQGETYQDAGATAVDDTDGTVAVAVSGTVDTLIVGTYPLIYTATDEAGNIATVTREVEVIVNTITILEPNSITVYQAQNSIPISIEFSSTAKTIEISNASGEVVYRTIDELSPLSSGLYSENLKHGENALNVTVVFGGGISLQEAITITVQKEPDTESATVNGSILAQLGLSTMSDVNETLSWDINQSTTFIIENSYTDGFVRTCLSDIVIEIDDAEVLSSEDNKITAIGAGTTELTLRCDTAMHILTITVDPELLASVKINPDYLLLRGIGTALDIEVLEKYSSGRIESSNAFIATVDNSALASVQGKTLTALQPGRTTLEVDIDGIINEVELEVVQDLHGAQGVVTVLEGGVLSSSKVISAETVSGLLILRPNTVSLDEEFTFAIVDPATLPNLAADSGSAIAAFSVSPDRQFVRNGIARITPSLDISADTLLSVSRLNVDSNTFERVGFALLVEDYIEVFITRGGTYILHGDISVEALAAKATSGFYTKNSASISADCKFEPQKQWLHNSDFSACDNNVSSSLLNKYRPILKVQKDGAMTQRGEFPMRVSDLLRQGRLVTLQGNDRDVDYKSVLGDSFILNELSEANAKTLLTANDFEMDGQIELRIEAIEGGTSNWRDYKGVPTVYGRVANTKYGEEQYTALQYWMFYAGSTLPSGSSVTWHEGDVEFFQVLLDKDDNPIGASTGQHYYGESKHWKEVERQGDNPVIYVARGSHATHFNDLDVKTETGNLGFLGREGNESVHLPNTTDFLNESEIFITPALIQEKGSSIFFQWRGRFGGFEVQSDGPPAPRYRGPSKTDNLSMYLAPAHYHFSYLMPGTQFASMMEALSRTRYTDQIYQRNNILQGSPGCYTFDGYVSQNPISDDLYELFHTLGKNNYEFQQNAINCPLVINDDINSYFNQYYSGGGEGQQADGLDCDYHGENISEAYRRYVISGLPRKKYDIADDDVISLVDLFAQTDPSCAQSFVDTDEDGLPDHKDADDDNDGLSDEAEVLCGSNPLLTDTDSDGRSDQKECQDGTNPTEPDVQITSVITQSILSDTFQITIEGLYFSEDLEYGTDACSLSVVSQTEVQTILSCSLFASSTSDIVFSLDGVVVYRYSLNFTMNIPPVADAGEDFSAAVESDVTLDASDSYDEDGSISKYIWSEGEDVLYEGPEATFIKSDFTVGEHIITLTVEDNNLSQSLSDELIVTILGEPADIDLGLIAYYPFDGDADDASGNGNHGIIHNSTLSTGINENVNSAYRFNSADDKILIENIVLGEDQPFSISAWIYSYSSAKYNGHIFDGNGVYFYTRPNGYTTGLIDTNNQNQFPDPLLSPRGTFVWEHVVITWDGQNLKTLKNASLFSSAVMTSKSIGTNNFLIGGSAESSITDIDIKVDELRLYNRPISLTEIQQLYQQKTTPSASGKLNDTGITTCSNADTNNLDCPVTNFEGQDAEHGRDALAAAGQLTKIGAGHAGFDFTKLDANGNDLSASASDWSCVRDNVTGLTWEVKTDDGGIHDKDNTYRWGGIGADAYGSEFYDDWDVLVNASNTEALCGGGDWRVPKTGELESLVSLDRVLPAIDVAYFPYTFSSYFWSASAYASNLIYAWYVHFSNGHTYAGGNRSNYGRVRLVRGGQ